MTDTAFDPATVPPFPIITLELRDDDTVSVNGAPVAIGMDESPRDAGLRAAAQVVAAQGLDAARVRALSPDGEHHLVVTAAGGVYDGKPPASTTATRERRGGTRGGKALGIGIMAVLVAVLAVVAVFAVRTFTAAPAPVASGPALPPGYHANAPVLAPPGYSEVANWALKVDDAYTPALIPGDRLAIVTDADQFELVDTKNGKVTWQGAGTPDGQDGVHYTHIGTRPALASSSNGQLELWALDLKTGGKTRSTTVATSTQAQVSYLGSSPLIDLGDQTVDIITASDVVRRDVPVTAKPILATDAGDVIAASSTHYWTIPAKGQTTSRAMPVPPNASGDPQLITATDDQHLLVIWPTRYDNVSIAALVDIATGAVTYSAPIPPDSISDGDPLVRSVDASTACIGSVFIDFQRLPRIKPVDQFDCSLIGGNTMYGQQNNLVSAVTDDDNGSVTAKPFTTDTTLDPTLPAAVSADTAYVVAEKVDATYVYALPAQGGSK